MTLLEILVLIIGIVTIIDAIIGMTKPKKMINLITKGLRSKSAWMIPFFLLILFLVFGYFSLQQLTIIQIVPGLFLGVILTKMMITAHPKETIPIAKKIYEKTDWFAIIIDLIVAGIIFWILFA